MSDHRRTEPTTRLSSRTYSRRGLLRGVGTAAAAAGLPAAAGDAVAQEGTDQGDEVQETVTTQVAIPTSATTFGQSNYVGLFLQVSGYNRDVDPGGVRSCGFVGSDADVTAYDAHLLETAPDDQRSETLVAVAVTSGTVIQPGKLFVVNSQSTCSQNDYVTVGLEEIGASSIETPTSQGGSSGGAIPGFGVLGALGGVAAATAAALRLSDDE